MQPFVELLPSGEFTIKRNNGQILAGRFSMYALSRFCKSQKIGSYIDLFTKIVADMSVDDYAELLMIAIQDYYRQAPNTAPVTSMEEMMDIIDEFDGLSGDVLEQLMRHAINRVGKTKPQEDNNTKQEELSEEKKSI